MANNCYNVISFFGNDKVIEQVATWRKQIESFKPSKEDPYCMKAIREVFYPNVPINNIDMGSKWVHLDDESTGAYEDQLGLQSAWRSPDLLLEHMTCLLFKLDPNVVVENLFNIEDGSIGFRYMTPNDEYSAYIQEGNYMINYEEYDDPQDAESEVYELYKDQKLEYISDLIVEMPGRFDLFKKFMPDLVDDWDSFKQELDERLED